MDKIRHQDKYSFYQNDNIKKKITFLEQLFDSKKPIVNDKNVNQVQIIA